MREPGGQLRAAIYARISRDREDTRLGVDRQVEDCRKLIDLAGWQVDERWVLVENDTSATSGPRPKFERLMAGMRAGEFDAVVVYRLDRLLRTMRDMATLAELFELTGTFLATADRQIDTSTEYGKASMIMWSALAAVEVESIRGRTRRKAEQNRRSGRPANGGSRPFSWEIDRVTLRPAEADALRHVGEQILKGASLTSMCRWLDAHGFLTPGKIERGPDNKPTGRVIAQARWTTPRLKGALLLPRHAGIVSHKGEPVLGDDGEPVRAIWFHPSAEPGGDPIPGEGAPIFDRDTHERLKQAVADRSSTPDGWSNTPQHVLSGIAVCGVCGGTLFATYAGARNGRTPVWSYRCRTHVSRARDPLERFVFTEVVRRSLDPAHRFQLDSWATVDQDELRRKLDAKRAQLADLERDFLANGGPAASFARITGALADEIETLEQERLTLLHVRTGVQWARIDMSEALAFPASAIPVQPPGMPGKLDLIEKQRDCLRAFLRSVVVHPAPRGRGFDEASVEIAWHEGQGYVDQAVAGPDLLHALSGGHGDTIEVRPQAPTGV